VLAGSDWKLNPASWADHEMNPLVRLPSKWNFDPSSMVSGEPPSDQRILYDTIASIDGPSLRALPRLK
jgi:hypothetical protein